MRSDKSGRAGMHASLAGPRFSRLLFAVALLGLTVSTACTCEGGPSDEGLREALPTYEASARNAVDGVVSVFGTVNELNAALDAGNNAKVGMLVDQFATQTAKLVEAADKLEEAEAKIQDSLGGGGAAASVRQPLWPILLVGLAAWGNYSYVQGLKAHDVTATAARTAMADKLALDPLADVTKEKAAIAGAGAGVLKDMTTNMVTTLVPVPVKVNSWGTLAVKLAGGKAEKKLMEVLATTSQCEQGLAADGCRIGVGRTDDTGRVRVPAGSVSVSVSGGGQARARVDRVTVKPGVETEIVVSRPIISEATHETVNNGGTTSPVDADAGTSSGGGVWLVCSGLGADSKKHYGCIPYTGSSAQYDALASVDRDKLCYPADYVSVYSKQSSDAACRSACRFVASAQTNLVCDTP